MVDDHDAVDRLGDLAEKVTRNQDAPSFGSLALEQAPKPGDSFWIETVGRFVEDQHLGIAQKGPGQAEPLEHPQRIARCPPSGGFG